jgi:hypothetical protein
MHPSLRSDAGVADGHIILGVYGYDPPLAFPLATRCAGDAADQRSSRMPPRHPAALRLGLGGRRAEHQGRLRLLRFAAYLYSEAVRMVTAGALAQLQRAQAGPVVDDDRSTLLLGMLGRRERRQNCARHA